MGGCPRMRTRGRPWIGQYAVAHTREVGDSRPGDEYIEPRQENPWPLGVLRDRIQGGSQLTHRAGRGDPVANDVTDCECDATIGENKDVIPVPPTSRVALPATYLAATETPAGVMSSRGRSAC